MSAETGRPRDRRLPGWVFVLLLAAILTAVGYFVVRFANSAPEPIVLEPEAPPDAGK